MSRHPCIRDWFPTNNLGSAGGRGRELVEQIINQIKWLTYFYVLCQASSDTTETLTNKPQTSVVRTTRGKTCFIITSLRFQRIIVNTRMNRGYFIFRWIRIHYIPLNRGSRPEEASVGCWKSIAPQCSNGMFHQWTRERYGLHSRNSNHTFKPAGKYLSQHKRVSQQ